MAQTTRRGESRGLIVGLVLAVTAFAFDGLSVTAAMPAIVRDLHGVHLYGAAFSAYMLANVFSLAISGPVADRHGPRPVLVAGLAVFGAGLVVGGAAPSMVVVVAGRAVQGLGAGTIGATAYVIIGRGFAPAARARLFAVLSAAWIVPGLVAPGVAGVVADRLSWRLVFFGLLPFPAIAAALALPALRHFAPGHGAGDPIRPRVVAAARLTAGTALIVGGLGSIGHAAGVVLVVAGVVVALPGIRALLPAGAARATPGLPAIIATRALINWSFFGTDAFVPLAVVAVRGRSNLTAGLALTTSSLAWSGAAWIQSKQSTRRSPRAVTAFGVVLIGLGVAVTALVLSQRVPVGSAFLGWAIAGAGMGFAFNTTSVAALDEAPSGSEGTTSSALQVADALGIAISTGVGGAILALASNDRGSTSAATLAVVFAVTGAAVVPALLASRGIAAVPHPRAPAPAD